MLKFIIIIAVISFMNGKCGSGCLSCDFSTSKCKLCNVEDFKILKEGECIQSSQQHCLQIDEFGNCLVCGQGYYLDQYKRICQEIPQENLINKCQVYSSISTCKTCQEGFYVDQNQCLAIDQSINHCLSYSSKDQCKSCEKGFVLALNKKECTNSLSLTYCSQATNIQCMGCKQNYRENPDKYLKEVQNTLQEDISQQNELIKKFTQYNIEFQDICEFAGNQGIVSQSDNQQTCPDGQIYLNGSCYLNIPDTINYCEQYLTIDQCRRCIQGYHLDQSYQCQKINEVSRCLSYDQEALRSICQQCINGYFLSIENLCQKRQIIFNECLRYSSDQDKCEECNQSNLMLNDQKTLCFEKIVGCVSYNQFLLPLVIQCLKCGSQLYLSDNNCVSGTVQNCQDYERSNDVCVKCGNGFSLESGLCQQSNTIVNCEQINTFNSSICDQCQSNHYLMNIISQCKSSTINNCEIHESINKCKECIVNYNLNSQQQCESMPTNLTNCLKSNLSQCILCKTDYYLRDGQCYLPDQYTKLNCQKYNTDGVREERDTFCEICQVNHLPLKIQNQFICLNQDELTNKSETPFNPINDCLSYYLNQQDQWRCQRCGNDKKVNFDGNCIAICNGQKYLIKGIDDYQNNQIFITDYCEQEDINNGCEIYSAVNDYQSKQSTLNFECIQCKTGYTTILNEQDIKKNNIIGNQLTTHYPNLSIITQPIDYFLRHSINCQQIDNSDLVAQPNCSYYKLFKDGSYYCGKCQFGYTGRVKNVSVDNCMVYDLERQRCDECIPGYKLDDSGGSIDYYSCIVNTPQVTNCDSQSFNEDRCFDCEQGYYLSDDGQSCTSRTNTNNCQVFHHNRDQCVWCNSGYQLSSDKTQCNLLPNNCIQVNDSGQCIECEYTHYLDNGVCQVVSDCLVFDSGNCIFYKNKLKFKIVSECVDVSGISNCVDYDSQNQCIECDSGYYLYENQCIQENQAPNGITAINDCKIYFKINNNTKCQQCQPGQHLEIYQNTQHCVQDKQYYYDTGVHTTININHSSLICQIYSHDKRKCVLCKLTFYMQNGICINEGKYLDAGQLKDIPSSLNCLQIQWINLTMVCKVCKTGYYLLENECIQDGYVYNNSLSLTALSSLYCDEWNNETKECSQCSGTRYKVSMYDHCCQLYYHHQENYTCYNNSNIDSTAYSCVEYSPALQKCFKCSNSRNPFKKGCTYNFFYYEHCVEVNLNYKQDRYCKKCLSSHFMSNGLGCLPPHYFFRLTDYKYINPNGAIDNCKFFSSLEECSVCVPNYYLSHDKTHCCHFEERYIVGVGCVSMLTTVNNCAFVNITDNQCIDCVSDQDGVSYYQDQTTNWCVKSGYYFDSSDNTQKLGSINHCEEYQNSSTCNKCNKIYNLVNNQCIDQRGCVEYDNSSKCIKCMNQFLLYDSGSIVWCRPKSSFQTSMNLEGALSISYDSNNCPSTATCTDQDNVIKECKSCWTVETCSSFYHKQSNGECTKLGYVYQNHQFTQYENKSCAVYTDLNNIKETDQCQLCYLDQSKCYTHNNFQLKIQGTKNGLILTQYFSYSDSVNDSNFYSNNYKSNGICVSHSQWFDVINNLIIDIDLDHCLRLSDTGDCQLCEDEYLLSSNFNCCHYSQVDDNGICKDQLKSCEDHNGYYLSNFHCCKLGQYWENQEGKCMPLIDQNCLQSHNGNHCNQCKTGYFQETTFWFEVTPKNPQPQHCQQDNFHKRIHLCLETNKYHPTNKVILSSYEFNNNILRCFKYDYQKMECEEYKSNTNPTDYGIICPNYHIAILIDKNYQCQNINDVMDNCKDFEMIRSQCINCEPFNRIYHHQCIADTQYMEIETLTFKTKNVNCEEFDDWLQICTQCRKNYYLSHGECVMETKRYDVVNSSEIDNINQYQNCSQVSDYDYCISCQSGYYLNRGQCVSDGEFVQGDNSTITTTIGLIYNILGSNTPNKGYQNCLKVNDNNDCIECQLPNYLIQGRCCLQSQIYNFINELCVDPPVITNCQSYYQNNQCQECQSPYHLTNEQCCQSGQFYNLQNNTCESPNRLINCKILSNNICSECQQNYVLVHQSGNKVCIDKYPSDHYCLEYETDSTCKRCQPNYRPNGSSIQMTSITCTANVYSNCKVQNVNQECLECVNGYYLVEDDSNNVTCELQGFNNCLLTNSSYLCIKCSPGYYNLNHSTKNCFKITQPSLILKQQTCKVGLTEQTNGNYFCLECISGYYINSSNQNCEEIPTTKIVDYCENYDSSQNCQLCINDYQLITTNSSKIICCRNDQIYISGESCDSLHYDNSQNCSQMNVGINEQVVECLACQSSYYLNNGGCCSSQQFYNGNQCYQQDNDHCLKIDEDGNCYSEDNPIYNCQSGYYLSQGHCCQINYYYSLNESKCLSSPTHQGNYLCQVMGDNGECILCYAGYYNSNGSCCPQNKVFNGRQCVDIEIPNCLKEHNNECIQCSSGFDQLTGSPECCSSASQRYIYDSFQQCVLLSPNCSSFNFYTKQCLSCVNSSHYQTGMACCPEDLYYDIIDSQCKGISTLSLPLNCFKILDKNVSLEKCEYSAGNHFNLNMIDFYENCQDSRFILFLEEVGYIYVQDFKFCQGFQSGITCTKCNTTYSYLYQKEDWLKICNVAGNPYESTKNIKVVKSIDNCLYQPTVNECYQCESNYWFYKVNGNVDECQLLNQKNGVSLNLPNCQQYNEDQTLCTKCSNNYYLYTDYSTYSVCCTARQYYIKDRVDQCIVAIVFQENCRNFHGREMRCLECNDGFYLDTWRCCALGQKVVNGYCVPIDSSDDCVHYSNGQCQQCKTGYYLSQQQCCLEEYYWDGSSCVISNINCKIHQDVNNCIVCKDNYYLQPTGQCCLESHYRNNPDNTCTLHPHQSKKNCISYDTTDLNDVKCLKCSVNYTLTYDGDCCTLPYIVNNENTDVLQFPIGCDIIDIYSVRCIKAEDGYYLYDGRAIPVNFYWNDGFDEMQNMSNLGLTDSNCIGYDYSQQKCILCSGSKKVDKNGNCVEDLIGCVNYNPSLSLQCQQCLPSLNGNTLYLTNGRCCSNGQYLRQSDNTCVNISSDLGIINCQQVNDINQCILCDVNYYNHHGLCCQYGYYNKSGICSNTEGITGCKIYGEDMRDCLECTNDDEYPIKTNNSKIICLKHTTIENCQSYILYDDQNMMNIKCNKCISSVTNLRQSQLLNTPLEVIIDFTQGSINGCLYYSTRNTFQGSSFQCIRCLDNVNYYVKDGQCIERILENCEGSQDDYIHDHDRCKKCKNGYYLLSDGSCKKNPDSCDMYDSSIHLCHKCIDNTKRLFYELPSDPNSQVLISRCVDINNQVAQTPSHFPSIILNCQLNQTNDNYSSPSSTTLSTSQCDTTKIYQNIPGYLDQYFSCHFCTNDSIPFVSLNFGGEITGYPIGIAQFHIVNSTTLMNTQSTSNTYTCLSPISKNFGNPTPFNFPPNCALGIINPNKIPDAIDSNKSDFVNFKNLSILCTACKEGYYPTRNTKNYYQVSKCNVIQNCDISYSHNVYQLDECAQCQSGYLFSHNGDFMDKTQCIQAQNNIHENCISGTSSQCNVCEKGYTLNEGFICEEINANYCLNGKYNQFQMGIQEDIMSVIRYQGIGSGCQECESSFIPFLEKQQKWYCTLSNLLNSGNFSSNNTVLDTNCLQYGVFDNEKAVCKKCVSTHILDIKYKCQSKILYPNCELAGDGYCERCEDNYITVNEECRKKQILNCKEYSQNYQNLIQICIRCNDGFYLKDNSCHQGFINNCKQYDQLGNCQQCNDSYALIKLKSGNNSCINNSQDSDCKEYDVDLLQEHKIKCLSCKSPNMIPSLLSQQYSTCNALNNIDNCIKYDIHNRFIDSTLECKECHQDYYYHNNQCNLRVNQVNHCSKLNLYQDQCELCQDNYYLTSDKSQCKPIPNSIPGCTYYRNDSYCEVCRDQFYQIKGKCEQVEEIIENCKIYLNSKECKECQGSYILLQNKCIQSIIPNCQQAINTEECIICDQGYQLTTKNNLRQCEILPDLFQCKTRSTLNLEQCKICNIGYFSFNGECKPVEKIVVNCLEYKDSQTCSKCKEDHLLTDNTCVTHQYTTNCYSLKLTSPFCVLCEAGYALNEQYQCFKNNNMEIKGCVKESADQSICQLCQPGFHNTEKGNCQQDNIIDTIEVSDVKKGIILTFLIFLSIL